MSPEDHIAEARRLSFNKTGQYLPDSEIFKDSTNNGGDTDYYKIPSNAKMLQDLIEHKNMNWNQGNIFKAVYRLNDAHHSDSLREINKILWFANRELLRLTNKEFK